MKAILIILGIGCFAFAVNSPIFIVIGILLIVCGVKMESGKSNVNRQTFVKSPMTQAVINEFKQGGNYVDVYVYRDRVEWYGHIIRYRDRGYKDLSETEETLILAKELLKAMPAKTAYIRKADYLIKPIIQKEGSSESYAGVRQALGDYSSDTSEATVGYYLHNKKFDGRFLKVLDESTGKEKMWDCKERKWCQEYKSW